MYVRYVRKSPKEENKWEPVGTRRKIWETAGGRKMREREGEEGDDTHLSRDLIYQTLKKSSAQRLSASSKRGKSRGVGVCEARLTEKVDGQAFDL